MNEFQRGSMFPHSSTRRDLSLSLSHTHTDTHTHTQGTSERSFQKRNFQQSCKFTLRFLAHHCRYSRNSEVAPLSSMLFLPSSAPHAAAIQAFAFFLNSPRIHARVPLDGIRFGSGVWPDFLPETIGAGCFVSPERERFWPRTRNPVGFALPSGIPAAEITDKSAR